MSDPRPAQDPVPPAIREVLHLFDGALGDLQFPDVDALVLADLEGDVRSRHEAVELARAALERARDDLRVSQDALAGRAKRGLAYLRVYAADDSELSARLDGLTLARAATPARAKRQKRRKPAKTESRTSGDAAGTPKPKVAELPLEAARRARVERGAA